MHGRPPRTPAELQLAQRLIGRGIRPTSQRLQVAAVLLTTDRHVTAEGLRAALRASGARVSKATLYNTLRLFAARGLVRELSVDGARVWFDSNVKPHYHFQDVSTGSLRDIGVGEVAFSRLPTPPHGMEIAGIDLVIRLRPARVAEDPQS